VTYTQQTELIRTLCKARVVKFLYFGRDKDMNAFLCRPTTMPVVTAACVRGGDYLYAGFSVCAPMDQFDKKRGRLIAFNRLINGINVDRGCRRLYALARVSEDVTVRNVTRGLIANTYMELPDYCKPACASTSTGTPLRELLNEVTAEQLAEDIKRDDEERGRGGNNDGVHRKRAREQ